MRILEPEEPSRRVYVVVIFYDGFTKVDKVYSKRRGAQQRVIRLKRDLDKDVHVGILKRSLQGDFIMLKPMTDELREHRA